MIYFISKYALLIRIKCSLNKMIKLAIKFKYPKVLLNKSERDGTIGCLLH